MINHISVFYQQMNKKNLSFILIIYLEIKQLIFVCNYKGKTNFIRHIDYKIFI